jgi:osmotically-inducible protein OsmY
MNAIKMIKSACCALVVVASVNVYAQSSGNSAAASAVPVAKSAKAANHALGKKVRAALTKTRNLSATNITVQAHGGAVILEGTVPDASQVDLATTAAKGVSGVNSVDNRLSIKDKGQ